MDELNFNNEPDKINLDKQEVQPDNNFSEQQFNNQSYDPYNQYQQQPQQYNSQSYQANQSQPQQPYGQPVQNNQYIQQPYGQPQQNMYQQYPQAPYGTAPAIYPNSQGIGMAVASLVLGISSIAFGILIIFFFPFALVPIIGLILGIVFKSKHLPNGKGVSTAGIITSSIGIVLPIIVVIIAILNMGKLLDFIEENSPEQYEQMYEDYYDKFPEWFDGVKIEGYSFDFPTAE